MKRLETNAGITMPNPMLHYKYITITLVVLIVGTLLVTTFALATNYKYVNEMAQLRAQNQHSSDLATQMLRETRAAAYENTKCKPLSQDELPIANLFGSRTTVERTRLYAPFVTGRERGTYKWLTTEKIFGTMSGGMTFNETSGQLRIPRNGTYYMHSTVHFQRNKDLEHDVLDLSVNIKIVTYCGSEYAPNKYINSASNPKHYVIIPKGKQGTSYSVHTSGIARLCENDSIFLRIEGMPFNIIIRSDGTGATNFGAFMIAPSCQEETANDYPTTNVTTTTTSPPTTTPTEPAHSSSTPNSRCEMRNC